MNLSLLSEQLKLINFNYLKINAGGCGKFALYLGRHLKRNNINFKYVLISYDDKNSNSPLSLIKNFKRLGDEVINSAEARKDNGYIICHIMIYYKGYFIDSTGVHRSLSETRWSTFNKFKLSAILSESILSVWCQQDFWNKEFDQKQLPKIQRRIQTLTLH